MEVLEREQSLATLTAARDAAASGRGRVVVISGEPGIGKTTVVETFVAAIGDDARVLVGTCDDLSIPRPLGPFRDLIGSVSTALGDAIAANAPPHEIHRLLIDELTLPPRPTLLVLEDVHWADNATLDVVTVLARRIAGLPAMLVLTFRTGEVPAGHSLEVALGSAAGAEIAFVDLQPLSEEAISALAGERAGDVYAATRGNPFFVSELVECDEEDVPRSVASAVIGRAARLAEDARSLVELISVVPGRVSTAVLDLAAPGWVEAAEEPERRHLLEVRPNHVRFRHELARHAILLQLPLATRRLLHRRILDALLETSGDPADVVHHAEAAGAEGVVGEYALVAARQAAAAESNREAFAHFCRTLDFLDSLSLIERAAMLEELTTTAYFVGRLDEAFAAVRQAIAIRRQLGDTGGVGRCMRVLSRLHWFVGDGAPARAAAAEAVAILEPLGDSIELARAYGGMGQLAMLSEDVADSFSWGERALTLATRVKDERTRAQALVNVGTTKVQIDPEDVEPLLHAHVIADRAGDAQEGTRALGNLGYTLMIWARPKLAREYARQALAYAVEHEVHNLAPFNATTLAWLGLRAGDWSAAETTARRQIVRGDTIPELLAKTVLAELAVRRGDDDATALLVELARDVDRTLEIHRITPAVELAAERALTAGTPMPVARIAELLELEPIGVDQMRLTAWAALAGLDVAPTHQATPPYAAMQQRDWRGAAEAFGGIGWTYDMALMLSLLDDPDALAQSLAIARELEARPLADRVVRRLRESGLRVPRGPRRTTRANPAHLTERQLEVLTLVADGRTNAEIADELVVSLRTAEHHVAAVLTKLQARDRREAARRARELGLLLVH